MRYPLAPLVTFVLVFAVTPDATAQILIDFGATARPTTGAPRSWNNIDPSNISGTTQLVDAGGIPTGATLGFHPSKRFVGNNTAGTTSPTPNSPLANLNYPITALSDTLWNSNQNPIAEFTLQNLDANAVYDFTICASRMSVSDVRTAEYAIQGFNYASAILDAANNSSNIVTINGIAPDANQAITVTIKAAPSNTNANGYYYINAMGIVKNGGNPPPPLLAFSSGAIVLSRIEGKPAASLPLTVSANRSPNPTITLTALDNATNAPPTWLTLPATVTGGRPFQLGFGNPALPISTLRATLTATAPGYPPATTSVTLSIRPTGSLNLLYYGNSFSQGNGTVPQLVEFITEDFGLPAPNTVARLRGGTNLLFHLTDPSHAAAITTALTPGEEWDYVILQGHSIEATTTLGNPAAFLANAEAIVRNVRAHSPAARAIMFQTWARAQGHAYYTGSPPTFTGPLQMHQQIEASYTQAVVNLDLAFGTDSARRAAAGETAALFNFAPAIYAGDLYHAGRPITLMSAMSIFTAIYGQSLSGFTPDFNATTNLVGRLKSFGMVEADWRNYVGVADRVADPALRQYPGSGEDLLLETSVGGPLTARPIKDLTAGKAFSVELTSPIGTANGTQAIIVMSWFSTGFPPIPPLGYPELHVHPAQSIIVASTPSLGKLSWQFPVTATVAGWSLFFQAAALVPSAKTGHSFTVTDGHEIRMK